MPKVSQKTFQTEKDDFAVLLKNILGVSAANEMVTLLAAGSIKKLQRKGSISLTNQNFVC